MGMSVNIARNALGGHIGNPKALQGHARTVAVRGRLTARWETCRPRQATRLQSGFSLPAQLEKL